MSAGSASVRLSTYPIDIHTLGVISYESAWELQRSIANARAGGVGQDTLLLLEHPSVFTAGRRTAPEDRPTDGTAVVDVDRGGKITWHGPGQLVVYPIMRLAEPVDVVNYVRRLEEALISVCTGLGLDCGRIDGRSGVWLAASLNGGVWRPERKVAAIGIRVQRGVALHGLAINCDPDLGAFDQIVPCGIRDAGVTSLSAELGRTVTVQEVRALLVPAVIAALEGTLAVSAHPVPRVTFAQATEADAQSPRNAPAARVESVR
jgi:lipoyl(octanoyl) transferase